MCKDSSYSGHRCVATMATDTEPPRDDTFGSLTACCACVAASTTAAVAIILVLDELTTGAPWNWIGVYLFSTTTISSVASLPPLLIAQDIATRRHAHTAGFYLLAGALGGLFYSIAAIALVSLGRPLLELIWPITPLGISIFLLPGVAGMCGGFAYWFVPVRRQASRRPDKAP